MNELKTRADRFEEILRELGAAKYSFVLQESEKQEFNTEGSEFKLLRTTFGGSVSLQVFCGTRMGAAGGNDQSEEGLRALAETALASAESSPEDSAHDIAPDQGKDLFRQGALEPELDKLFERLQEMLADIKTSYPLVNIMAVISSYTKSHSLYRNTNGTEFERLRGSYDVTLEFSASDGTQNTGLDYVSVLTDTLDQPLLELGGLKQKLEDVQKQLGPTPMSGKFEGTVVFTPDCLGYFLYMIMMKYCTGGVILDGTSQWLDKVGEQVADERLTVALDPFDSRIVCGERYTADGFRSEPVTVIENGVLKTHILELYTANKTGRPVTKNGASSLLVREGDESLADIIGSIDKGLLVGGFSGGSPGANGEFSGVAKNSFLIENGKVGSAVTETMISGNLGRMLQQMRGISRETCMDGSSVLPYLAVDGITISGK